MAGTGGFQTQCYPQPAMAVAGDFCSNNPYFSFDAGPGGLVAGSSGVTVGLFAWVHYPPDADGTPSQVFNNPGPVQPTGTHGGTVGPPNGFVHRAQQALITTFLADASMVIPQGFPVTLMAGGDFWVVNNGTTDAQVGQKAFANPANGQALFAGAGSIGAPSALATSVIITSAQWSGTGSITGDVLTVTANAAGGVYPGATVGSPGVGVVVAVLTGSPTGTGTFLLSMNEQAVTSTNLAANYGLLSIGGQPSTTVPIAVGDAIFASNGVSLSPTTIVSWMISGSGTTTTQTAVVNQTTAIGTTIMQFGSSVETKWFAGSTGLPGELVKITDHPPL